MVGRPNDQQPRDELDLADRRTAKVNDLGRASVCEVHTAQRKGPETPWLPLLEMDTAPYPPMLHYISSPESLASATLLTLRRGFSVRCFRVVLQKCSHFTTLDGDRLT